MPEAKVIALPEYKLEEAVKVQVEAFMVDPIFDFFFPGDVQQKSEKMHVTFESGCRYRFLTGEPVLALERGGEIVGVANVRTPDPIEQNDAVDALWKEVGTRLGPEAEVRFEEYQKLKKRHLPEKPHHYLVSLCIKPGHQGMGLGGQLLEAVCKLSEDHETSEATVLDTGTDANVKFYQKHRFEIIGEGDLDGVPSYWMIRNN